MKDNKNPAPSRGVFAYPNCERLLLCFGFRLGLGAGFGFRLVFALGFFRLLFLLRLFGLRRFRLAGRRLRLALRDLDAFVLDQTAELAGEAREPSAAVDELLLTAGPGRVRLRVDLELHRVARLAPGRARRV